MGLKDDLRRFEEIGTENRMDLTDFMDQYELRPNDDTISVPVTIINLPEFAYAKPQEGGIGQGEGAEQGDPVDEEAQEGDGDGDEAGDGGGEHGHYEMDPEEFAQELDEEFDLDLDPKGKKVIEEIEGDFTDIARTGPDSTLDVDHLYKEGLKRTMAMSFDEDYLREVMRVEGMGPDAVFEWARKQSIAVSKQWIDQEYAEIDDYTKYASLDDIPGTLDRQQPMHAVDDVKIRRDDERYRHPEIEEKRQKNVVVVNIRDVSGSMHGTPQELVEQVMTPLDWYLQGKYDHAEFIYIAHDAEAWECDRQEFFGIQSGGGTRVSSAYELARELLKEYPFNEWNRYVFGAGDGGNRTQDTKENLVPIINDIEANMHGYIEVGTAHKTDLNKHLDEDCGDNVVTTTMKDKSEVSETIKFLLQEASAQHNDEETND